jgi:hypothetical protein
MSGTQSNASNVCPVPVVIPDRVANYRCTIADAASEVIMRRPHASVKDVNCGRAGQQSTAERVVTSVQPLPSQLVAGGNTSNHKMVEGNVPCCASTQWK